MQPLKHPPPGMRLVLAAVQFLLLLVRSANASATLPNPPATVHQSWVAIYAALLLTLLQIAVFLLIFECCRRARHRGIRNVYDRRRFLWPNRVPPPLMQQTSWKNWFGEWWRLRLTDLHYMELTEHEAVQRRLEELEEEGASPEKQQVDSFLIQAEQQVWEDSPFGGKCCEPLEEDVEKNDGQHTSERTDSTAFLHLDQQHMTGGTDIDVDAMIESRQRQQEGLSTSSLNNGLIDSSGHTPLQTTGTPPCIPNGQPFAARSPPLLRRVSSGGDLTTLSNRRVRFDGKDMLRSASVKWTQARERSRNNTASSKPSIIDVPIGSEKSDAWLQMMYNTEHQRHPTWDTAAARTASTMVLGLAHQFQKRVLHLRDHDEELGEDTATINRGTGDGEEEDDKNDDDDDLTSSPNVHTVSRARLRRPLTEEDTELLECIGLDSFMMLRFLKMGADIAFWPLIMACILLIPVYKLGGSGQIGFYTGTVINLNESPELLWFVVLYGMLQYCYVLRRLWVEWEVFIPLRHDFLENGDFIQPHFRDQYRKTCLVEYVPHRLKHGQSLYEFFDSILVPGSVQRAEVVLNTEHLYELIAKRRQHLIQYEDTTAKEVSASAKYYRKLAAYQKGGLTNGQLVAPKIPKEPKMIVKFKREHEDTGMIRIQTKTITDTRRVYARAYHQEEIGKLNKLIEDEYIRLARERRRPVAKTYQSRIAKWLKLKYLSNRDTGSVHSSTAFIEFRSMMAKQAAIQCNLAGAAGLLAVTPVPEVRDIIWRNAHISQRLIYTRKIWANIALGGALIGWSCIVTLIRSVDNVSWYVFGGIAIAQTTLVSTILDNYLPALLVEGIVRIIPFPLRFIAQWIRFKTVSEVDLFVLKWYFGFRLVTFVFVIIAVDLVGASEIFLNDPVGFVKIVANHVAVQSQFFITYVMVAGGLQIFARMSQAHNALLHFVLDKATREEAVSERRIEKRRKTTMAFHLDEFVPLFLFVFMVGMMYGWIAPIANAFVFAFFLAAFKVFKFMSLYIYSNRYEAGGFLFYTMNSILFGILYGMLVLMIGYLSAVGSAEQAGIFSIMIFVTMAVHRNVYQIFVQPSKTLSLVDAAASDESVPAAVRKKRKFHEYRRAKKEWEDCLRGSAEATQQGLAPLMTSGRTDTTDAESWKTKSNSVPAADNSDVRLAIARMEEKYRPSSDYSEDERLSDLTLSDTNSDMQSPARSFFIYREPALNRATWESQPRPYRRELAKRRHDHCGPETVTDIIHMGMDYWDE